MNTEAAYVDVVVAKANAPCPALPTLVVKQIAMPHQEEQHLWAIEALFSGQPLAALNPFAHCYVL
jgi:hypothetical protein